MLDEKDLQAIAQMMDKMLDKKLDEKLVQQKQDILGEVSGLMDKKLSPISARLDTLDAKVVRIQADMAGMKEDISQLKENVEIATVALDRVIGWADKVTDSTGFPLPRV